MATKSKRPKKSASAPKRVAKPRTSTKADVPNLATLPPNYGFRFGNDTDDSYPRPPSAVELTAGLLAIENHLTMRGLDERSLAAARLVSVVRRALQTPLDDGKLATEMTASARRVEKLLGEPEATIPGVTADKQAAELVKAHVVEVLASAHGKSESVATEVVVALLADRARGAARLFPLVDVPKWIEELAPIIAAHKGASTQLAEKLIRACAKLAGFDRPDRLFALRT